MATVTTMNSHHFVRQPMESTDGSMDSNDISNHYSGHESPSIDNNSCSSDDTVLSVGNENPPVTTTTDTLSFKNIESHLNAISNLTNTTLAEVERNKNTMNISTPSSPLSTTLLSPAASTKSISQSPTPSVYHMSDSKSSPTSPSPLFRPMCGADSGAESAKDSCYLRQTPMLKSNDNNEQNIGGLKFSIDNILKADFGRRITDPINIKKSKVKKSVQSKSCWSRGSEQDGTRENSLLVIVRRFRGVTATDVVARVGVLHQPAQGPPKSFSATEQSLGSQL
ncbi:hypothetical protein CBL_08510 [Carabus blaptoides fortunei]